MVPGSIYQENGNGERDGVITIDGVNAERWVIGQVGSSSRGVGLLPNATGASAVVVPTPKTCTHN